VGKHEGKRPLGRPRRVCEDNIKMEFEDVECRGMGCIDLSQDRDRWHAPVKPVMNIRFPLNAGNYLIDCEPKSFSRSTAWIMK